MSRRNVRGRDPKRGRHRNRRSPETNRWETEHLIPTRPEWMPSDVYTALAGVREGVVGSS